MSLHFGEAEHERLDTILKQLNGILALIGDEPDEGRDPATLRQSLHALIRPIAKVTPKS